MWSGRYYVIAVDYDRCDILNLCPFDSNKRKYVHFECLKTYKKLNMLGVLKIF